ncbi:MAG TPA: glycosyltransferase family 4 protein [Marinobacterium sp.]|nr:glycosyltransferase family 4 protein [Marinobacterium sp.]
MKVVQVLPALELGGVERGTLDIAKALVEEGHESVVISAGGRLVQQLVQEGSRHVTWDLGKKSPLTFLKFWSVRKWLREECPDIVHVRSRMPAWVVWLAWKGMPENDRPRFITTLHGMHSVNWYSAIMGRGETVICVSETCKRYLLDNYSEPPEDRTVVIHRGIDSGEFSRGYRPDSDWLAKFSELYPNVIDHKLVCFPGRITRWKGHLELVKVAEKLAEMRQDFRFLVVGSDPKGHFIEEFKQAITTKELDNYFIFLGTRKDMRELYAICDASLSLTTTTEESFGRTVVESLAIGTPVIGYGHGAVSETLSAMFPYGKVAVGDVDSLVLKLNRVLDGEYVHIGELKFTLADMRARTLELYATALKQ